MRKDQKVPGEAGISSLLERFAISGMKKELYHVK
jgi:hypothetical protein